MLSGETFPRCAECENDVHFELIAEAQEAQTDMDFRIRLYEIPHPKAKEEEEEKEKTA